MKIGFSTGSIAYNDVLRGLSIATHHCTNAVELSALREDELDLLLNSLDQLENHLLPFEYISFHAPSKRVRFTEEEFVNRLRKVAERGWPIIIHPDVIENTSLWRTLGRAVCIENMDKRKEFGRTAAQLQAIFSELPDATFCFDIGHARQVDPTMLEAETFLKLFDNRLRQVHMSYVNSQSRHERLNFESIQSFQRVSHLINEETPIILETPIHSKDIEEEIEAVKAVFNVAHSTVHIASIPNYVHINV